MLALILSECEVGLWQKIIVDAHTVVRIAVSGGGRECQTGEAVFYGKSVADAETAVAAIVVIVDGHQPSGRLVVEAVGITSFIGVSYTETVIHAPPVAPQVLRAQACGEVVAAIAFAAVVAVGEESVRVVVVYACRPSELVGGCCVVRSLYSYGVCVTIFECESFSLKMVF